MFTGDISKWNVSNVKEMSKMFMGSMFNSDISGWDVSNVRIMDMMFKNSKFNGVLSTWRPVSCWNFIEMFQMSSFSGDISGWPEPELDSDSPNSSICASQMFRNSRIPVGFRPEWAVRN